MSVYIWAAIIGIFGVLFAPYVSRTQELISSSISEIRSCWYGERYNDLLIWDQLGLGTKYNGASFGVAWKMPSSTLLSAAWTLKPYISNQVFEDLCKANVFYAQHNINGFNDHTNSCAERVNEELLRLQKTPAIFLILGWRA